MIQLARGGRIIHADKKFLGMDASRQPEDLPPGFMQRVENRYISHGDGLELREGFQGIWTTALTGPLYAVCVARPSTAGNPSWLIVASGGKLYRSLETDVAPTEILDAGGVSFAAPNNGRDFRIVQTGNFLYGIDGGSASAPFKIEVGVWTTTRLTGLAAPTDDIDPLTLYTRETDPTSNPSVDSLNWEGYEPPVPAWSTYVNASNYDFKLPTQAGDPTKWQTSGGGDNSWYATDWTVQGQCERWLPNGPTGADITPNTGANGVAFLFDQANNGLSQVISSIPDWETNSPLSDPPSRKARIFVVTPSVNANVSAGGLASYTVRLSARDSLDGVMASAEQTFTPPADTAVSSGNIGPGVDWINNTFVASFMGLANDPDNLFLEVMATDSMVPITATDPSVVFIQQCPVQASQLRLTAGANTDDTQIRIERAERGTIPLSVTGRSTAYLWIRRNFATTQDWSDKSSLTFGIEWNPEVLSGLAPGYYPALRLGFQVAGTSDVVWTAPVAYAGDGRSFSVSLETISQTLLGAFDYMYVQVLEDMTPESDPEAYLFDFGPITEPALTEGVPVQYYVSHFAGTVPSDPAERVGVESSRSPLSVQVTPTATKRAVTGTIPAGPPPTGTTHYLLWRVGGAFSDGRGRLVAAFPVGSNASGSTYGWTYTTRVFTDWTPDDSIVMLDGVRFEKGRDNLPTGCVDILAVNGRLLLAKDRDLYWTWPLSANSADGTYTTNAPDPTDPLFLDKGYSLQRKASSPFIALSTTASDNLDQRGAYTIGWLENSHIVIAGSEPGQIQLSDAVAYGLFAPRATAIDDRNRTYHVGTNGLYRLRGTAGASEFYSEPLEPLASSEAVASPAGYANCDLLYHNRRVYWFAPAIGGTTNSLVYVRDDRAGDNLDVGWSVLSTSVASGFTSGLSVNRTGNTSRAYFAGNDGQLYRLVAGGIDRATPAGTLTAISWRILSRSYGQSTAEGVYMDSLKRIQDIYFGASSSAADIMQWSLSNENGLKKTGDWIMSDALRTNRRVPIYQNIDGVLHTLELSGLAIAESMVRNWEVVTTVLAARR